jgi:cobalt-zinc-cadmium efflux system outer membrane protein
MYFRANWLLSVVVGASIGSGSVGLSLRGADTEIRHDPAGTEKSLTLDAAVRMALGNNPGLRAVGGEIGAARGRAIQARSWPNPELELAAEEWPVSNGRGFSDAKQTLGISQTLPFPGKKAADRRIGSAGIRLSESEFAIRQTELVRDVKAAFFQALAAERSFEVSAQLVEVAESSAASARKKSEAGATTYQEQLRAEVQWEQARMNLTELRRDMALARQLLAKLIGLPDLDGMALAGALNETPEIAAAENPTEAWLPRHPSAIAARANLDRARIEHQRARIEPYPDVRLGVAGGRLGDTDQSIIELRLGIPLPILDTSKGRREEALAEIGIAEAQEQAVIQQLRHEWANARKRYHAAAEQVARYQQNLLPKAEEALRLVRIGFEEGKYEFIDLLDTQRTTAEARLDYQQRLLELNLAEAELEALLRPQSFPTTNNH